MVLDDVTLAIPCYNVSGTLPGTLEAADRLDPAPTRVVGIDDGSDDETAQILTEADGVELVEHETNRGLAAARNTALATAETDFLAMIDADIRPRPEWLGKLRREMERSPAALIAGRVLEVVETDADRWRSLHLSQDHGPEPHSGEPVVGANGLFDTRAVENIGGWNPKYRTNYEDIDICERLLDEGYSIRYTPEAIVEHHRTDTPRSILETTWNHHFNRIDEPESVTNLPRRIGRHIIETGNDLERDIKTGSFDMIPITLRRPFVHLRRDVNAIRSNE